MIKRFSVPETRKICVFVSSFYLKNQTNVRENMGKRGGARKGPGSNDNISLREEITGKSQKKGGSCNAKQMLKVEHLERLAVWAGGEASMPCFGAFFGHKLASVCESLGVPPNTSLFPCQRCETVLQPGFNCTVRIEKNKAKPRRRRSKKPFTPTQNNVVYTCQFCSHRNLRRGTSKGHMKEICPPKIKTAKKTKPAKSNSQKPVSSEEVSTGKDEANKLDESALPPIATSGTVPITDDPVTPIAKTGPKLLEMMQRKRERSTAKKPAESKKSSVLTDAEKTIGMPRKRRRKSGTSLKEIAERSEHGKTRNVVDLPIPFFL